MTDQTEAAAYVDRALARARVIEDVPADTSLIPIRKVGIIGAGTMGGGIAMNFANVGLSVHLVETESHALDRGLGVIRGNYERSASRGRFPAEEVDVRMGRIGSSLDMAGLADCDLVIEAVFEDIDLKKRIFARLDGIAKPGAILASNTSGLDVNEIAGATARPDAVIGLHFFSPANVMKLLEVVRGARTSGPVLATAMTMAHTIGKVAVVSGVCPGFIGNRMLYPRQIRARELLRRGALPWDVDRVLKEFGFKMGPFEMADLAGLDIGWAKGAVTDDPLRDALCEQDRRGQKTRAGYYDYADGRTPTPSLVVAELIRSQLDVPAGGERPDDRDILEECLFPLVNEGAMILEEGMAQRPSDIDLVWLYGYNWPASTGGPMHWADGVGLDRVLDKARQLGASNPAFAPAALLQRLVAESRGFASLS